MKIKNIIPYAKNARHNKKAIPKVAESIKEFVLRGQIILESKENPVIVCGHTRVEACKSLGWDEIPDENIAFCDGLSEEQIKAYRLADNRTGEIATWNQALLKNEIKSIKSIDMSKFQFDFKSKNLSYGHERFRTDNFYNLGLCNRSVCFGKYEMPPIEPCDYVPTDLLAFNYAKSTDDYTKTIHFFIDDYQFERIWSKPEKYLDLLSNFEAVLTPDFSLYMDMPMPLQLFNEYRRRMLGYYWQQNGLKVIPTISWSNSASYDFCFDGLPLEATLVTSSVGVKNSNEALTIWHDGMKEAIKRLKPKRILLYGGNPDFNFGDIEVIEYKANTAFR